MGHFRMQWDEDLHRNVGTTTCGNGDGQPCPTLGYARHRGNLFGNKPGLPITATGSILGPIGGFGWSLDLAAGAPRNVVFDRIEVLHKTPLLVSIAYPPGTNFTIATDAGVGCFENNGEFSCNEVFEQVDSIEQVRSGPGNQYHVDSSGVLTFRIIQLPPTFVGRRDWFFPMTNTTPELVEIDHFERAGMYLPRYSLGPRYTLQANCEGSGVYCSEKAHIESVNVCPNGYTQVAYDRCCPTWESGECLFANGSFNVERRAQQNWFETDTVSVFNVVCFFAAIVFAIAIVIVCSSDKGFEKIRYIKIQ